MPVGLPKITVGDPLRHESLSVFPLFSDATSEVDYQLSDVALAAQSLLIEEVDQNGSVPDLLVENNGEVRVLFLEGEELIGAKQNRILNTSVLVAPHTKIKIPVSCVEQGRWRYKSRFFGSSGSHSPAKLRRALKASVSKSVKEKRGHTSDQAEVWMEVALLHASHGVESDTHAMSDAFDSHQAEIASYRDKLKYVGNATGVAIAVGDRIVSVDLFDKPSTCKSVWDRMLSGVVFDALEAARSDEVASRSDVQLLIDSAADLPWEQSKAVGEGEEYRAESARGDLASALAVEQTVVHGSVLTSL